jgi:hypothetical protein
LWRQVARGAIALLLWVLPSAALAQSLTTGGLLGRVLDEDGVPLFDVLVTVIPSSGGVPRLLSTPRDGDFEFDFLMPGDYEVLAERLGYVPARVTGVRVQPGARARVELTVRTAESSAATSVDQRVWDGAASSAYVAGMRIGATRERMIRMPGVTRDLADAARLSSFLGEDLSARGLPGSYTGFFVDGTPVHGARHPLLGQGSGRSSILRMASFDQVQVVQDDPDVELSGFAGSFIAGQGRRGGRTFMSEAWAEGSAGALSSSKHFDAADAGGTSLQGGVVLSGPIVVDTAHFMAGIELIRREAGRAALLNPEYSPAAESVLNGMGSERSAFGEPFTAQSNILTGFGSLDWSVADAHRIFARLDFASLTAAEPDLPGGGLVSTSSGTDLLASGGVSSRIGTGTALEFRFGLERSSRDYEAAEGGTTVPWTGVASGSFGFGLPAVLAGTFQTSSLSIGETLLHRAEEHQVKVGVGAWLGTHERTGGPTAPEFYFSDASSLETRRGYSVRSRGAATLQSFATRQFYAFIQDRWDVSPEAEVLFGVRAELERLPLEDIESDGEWEARSQLANRTLTVQPLPKLSPRVGFSWDLGGAGRYFLRGAAGIYHQSFDPDVLAEVLTETSGRTVERRTGNIGGWPSDPTGGTVVETRTLSILGPEFRAPRSDRGTLGLGMALGSAVSLDLAASYSRTTGLPRRTDLNRLPGVVERDQAGRPIYGELVQDGGLLYARPASNRRFSDYDAVYALHSDGEAETVSFTAGFDREVETGPSFHLRYTFSRTTDDWMNAGLAPRGAGLSPFTTDDAWVESTADFDVPHRMVAGVDVPVPNVPVRVSAFYRFESGLPFTPGFPIGVDANGDGVFGNDPAFVGNVAGISDIVAAWPCLNDETNGFVQRNACRDPDTHRLDLRVSADLAAGQNRFVVFAEAVNIMDSEVAIRDRALYRVDPSGSLQRDAATGRVIVPLVANPEFGEPIVLLSSGRTVRLGLQVRF